MLNHLEDSIVPRCVCVRACARARIKCLGSESETHGNIATRASPCRQNVVSTSLFIQSQKYK